jgi:magnesium chelatase family protein
MGPAGVRQYCRLDDAGKSLPLGPAICEAGLRAAMSQLGMSARIFHRILKLARTIADLERAPEIKTHYLAEAIQYCREGRSGSYLSRVIGTRQREGRQTNGLPDKLR